MTKRIVFSVPILFFLMTLSGFGQVGSVPAGGGASTTPRPDSIGDTGYWGYMANAPGGVISGPALFGKVVLDGNPLVWEPITVTVSCATGKTDLMTATGPDGKFVIDHVNLTRAYTAAGDLRNQMEQHFDGCAVRAELAGYHSTADTITQRVMRDNPFLQDITLSPQENAPGTDLSAVSGSVPEAQKAFQKAHDEWMRRSSGAAKSDLEQVVKLDPKFAEAWYLLGRIQAASDIGAATESLQQAQAQDPRFVPPCVWLAMIAIQKRDWQEASVWSSRALALNPTGTPRIWYEKAVADFRLGKNEAAHGAAERALAMDPEHTVQNAEEVLALTLIDKGDYSGALDHLRNSLTYLPSGPDADLVKKQIAFVEQKTAQRK